MTEKLRVYIDANIFIYAVESSDALTPLVWSVIKSLARRPAVGMTSELTLAEVLSKADDDLRQQYMSLMVLSRAVDLSPVSREILIEAARLRRAFRCKLPDAIHIATAVSGNCTFFLSNDRRLKLPDDLAVVCPDQEGLTSLMAELA